MLTHYPLNTTGRIALSSSVPGGTLIGHLPFTKRPHFPPHFLAIKIQDHSNGAHSFTRTYQFPRNRGDATERPRRKMASTSSLFFHHPNCNSDSPPLSHRRKLFPPAVPSIRPQRRAEFRQGHRVTLQNHGLTKCQSDFYTCNPAT